MNMTIDTDAITDFENVESFAFLRIKNMEIDKKIATHTDGEQNGSQFDTALARVATRALNETARRMELDTEYVLDGIFAWNDTILVNEARQILSACANGENLTTQHDPNVSALLVEVIAHHIRHYGGSNDIARIMTLKGLSATA